VFWRKKNANLCNASNCERVCAVQSFFTRLAGSKLRESPEQTQLGSKSTQRANNDSRSSISSSSKFRHRRTFAGIIPDLSPMVPLAEKEDNETLSFTDVTREPSEHFAAASVGPQQSENEMWLFNNTNKAFGTLLDASLRRGSRKSGDRSRSIIMTTGDDDAIGLGSENNVLTDGQDTSDSEFFDRLKKIAVAAVDFVIVSTGVI
jgi:hypothetical protein